MTESISACTPNLLTAADRYLEEVDRAEGASSAPSGSAEGAGEGSAVAVLDRNAIESMQSSLRTFLQLAQDLVSHPTPDANAILAEAITNNLGVAFQEATGVRGWTLEEIHEDDEAGTDGEVDQLQDDSTDRVEPAAAGADDIDVPGVEEDLAGDSREGTTGAEDEDVAMGEEASGSHEDHGMDVDAHPGKIVILIPQQLMCSFTGDETVQREDLAAEDANVGEDSCSADDPSGAEEQSGAAESTGSAKSSGAAGTGSRLESSGGTGDVDQLEHSDDVAHGASPVGAEATVGAEQLIGTAPVGPAHTPASGDSDVLPPSSPPSAGEFPRKRDVSF